MPQSRLILDDQNMVRRLDEQSLPHAFPELLKCVAMLVRGADRGID